MKTDTISVESGKQFLRIAPELGGAVAAWNWITDDGDRIPLFRPWDGISADPYALSCFPLVPWTSRISAGGFEFDGVFYPLHPNRAEEPFPIHGDGWLQHWHVVERSDDRIKITLESRGYNGNPYVYRSTQTFLLLPDGLQIDLTVTHLGQDAMPYGLGLHPYFPRNTHTRLQSRAEGVWLSSENLLPSEHSTRFPPTWDYNQPAPLPMDAPLIDHCFTGWNGKAILDYPDRGLAIHVVMPDCNGYNLLYRPPFADFFSLAPTTHPIDAFHLPEFPGLAYLCHGESLALRTKFLIGKSISQ